LIKHIIPKERKKINFPGTLILSTLMWCILLHEKSKIINEMIGKINNHLQKPPQKRRTAIKKTPDYIKLTK